MLHFRSLRLNNVSICLSTAVARCESREEKDERRSLRAITFFLRSQKKKKKTTKPENERRRRCCSILPQQIDAYEHMGEKCAWANRARHACVRSLADGEHRKNIHIIEDFTVIHQTKETPHLNTTTTKKKIHRESVHTRSRSARGKEVVPPTDGTRGVHGEPSGDALRVVLVLAGQDANVLSLTKVRHADHARRLLRRRLGRWQQRARLVPIGEELLHVDLLDPVRIGEFLGQIEQVLVVLALAVRTPRLRLVEVLMEVLIVGRARRRGLARRIGVRRRDVARANDRLLLVVEKEVRRS